MTWTQFWLLMSAVYISSFMYPSFAVILGGICLVLALIAGYRGE